MMKDVGVEKADPLASQTNNKEQLKSVKSDLDAKQKQAQELTAQLAALNNEITQLEAQQAKLEGKAVSLEERAMNEETENILNVTSLNCSFDESFGKYVLIRYSRVNTKLVKIAKPSFMENMIISFYKTFSKSRRVMHFWL